VSVGPSGRPAMSAEALVSAWRNVPRIDLDEFRRDIDGVLDPFLPLGADLPLSAANAKDVAGISGLDAREVRPRT
jgi:hypothetical protein